MLSGDLILFQIRPQILKGFRRPPLTLSNNKPLQQAPESLDSTSPTPTVIPIQRSRSRPTYIPTTSSAPVHASSPRSDAIRRRYGRPSTSGERKQYTPINQRSTTEASGKSSSPNEH